MFIDFVHNVIRRILSPFKAFILMYFLDLLIPSNFFIHRENYLALLIVLFSN